MPDARNISRNDEKESTSGPLTTKVSGKASDKKAEDGGATRSKVKQLVQGKNKKFETTLDIKKIDAELKGAPGGIEEAAEAAMAEDLALHEMEEAALSEATVEEASALGAEEAPSAAEQAAPEAAEAAKNAAAPAAVAAPEAAQATPKAKSKPADAEPQAQRAPSAAQETAVEPPGQQPRAVAQRAPQPIAPIGAAAGEPTSASTPETPRAQPSAREPAPTPETITAEPETPVSPRPPPDKTAGALPKALPKEKRDTGGKYPLKDLRKQPRLDKFSRPADEKASSFDGAEETAEEPDRAAMEAETKKPESSPPEESAAAPKTEAERPPAAEPPKPESQEETKTPPAKEPEVKKPSSPEQTAPAGEEKPTPAEAASRTPDFLPEEEQAPTAAELSAARQKRKSEQDEYGNYETPEEQYERTQTPRWFQRSGRANQIKKQQKQILADIKKIIKEEKPISKKIKGIESETSKLKWLERGARMVGAWRFIGWLAALTFEFWIFIIPLILFLVIALTVLFLAFLGIYKGTLAKQIAKKRQKIEDEQLSPLQQQLKKMEDAKRFDYRELRALRNEQTADEEERLAA